MHHLTPEMTSAKFAQASQARFVTRLGASEPTSVLVEEET
jgi:hypothetical protein